MRKLLVKKQFRKANELVINSVDGPCTYIASANLDDNYAMALVRDTNFLRKAIVGRFPGNGTNRGFTVIATDASAIDAIGNSFGVGEIHDLYLVEGGRPHLIFGKN